MPTSVSWDRRQGRRGQPRLRRGASLHFSTNTQSKKWSSPTAGGNQLVSDVIPHSSHPVGWLQSHGWAVRISTHERRDWLVCWEERGGTVAVIGAREATSVKSTKKVQTADLISVKSALKHINTHNNNTIHHVGSSQEPEEIKLPF